MKFYYTGALHAEDAQVNPENSLGGFISSTIIPNDLLANLFTDISLFSLDKLPRETKGVILENDSIDDLENVIVYFEYPTDALCKLEIAAVTLVDNNLMERLSNSKSLPYQATFHEANGLINAVNLGNLVAGAKIGIWLKRTFNTVVKKTPTQLYADYVAGTTELKEEKIKLCIDWNIDESSSSGSSSSI